MMWHTLHNFNVNFEFLLSFVCSGSIPYLYDKLEAKVPYPFEAINLHSLMRIQLPSGEFITRSIYLATWSSEVPCCQSTCRTLKWIPLDIICNPSMASAEQVELLAQFWGSEVVTYAGHLNSLKLPKLLASNKISLVSEQTLFEMLKYVNRGDLTEEERTELDSPTTRMFAEFVAAAKYNERDVIKLYSDFAQHCYPSTNMSFTSYKDYCEKIGLGLFLDDARLRKAFQASNYKFKNYLSFTEFLLGLVSLDPDSPHTRPRFSFIFRYYDSNSDGSLSQEDMKRLFTDMRRFIKWRMTTSSLNLTQFVEEITAERLKGTATLCRSTRSILRMIKATNVYESITYRSIPTGTQVNGNCTKCRPKGYTVAVHSLALTPLGGLVEPLLAIPSTAEPNEPREAKLMRDHSLEYIFKGTSYGNYVLDLIRKLRNINKMSEERKRQVRTEVINGLTFNVITGLCEEVTDLVQNEARVLQVSTPVFVLGDIHGNISDLLTFETQIWPMAPAGIGPNYLFLGDYVDRGEFSIEVVCYLMKLLAPSKFFLLRGNHEIRGIQRAFTFEKECMEKYANNGMSVFEIFNRVFDCLPFAAVIDENIFCAHGGIPFTITSIEGLNQLPTSISEPEQEAPALWEVSSL